MKKERDKLFSIDGVEVDSNIVGFCEGIDGKKIIIYTTADNEKELLASYYTLKDNIFSLEEITSDKEWDNLEKQINELVEKFRSDQKNKKSN